MVLFVKVNLTYDGSGGHKDFDGDDDVTDGNDNVGDVNVFCSTKSNFLGFF